MPVWTNYSCFDGVCHVHKVTSEQNFMTVTLLLTQMLPNGFTESHTVATRWDELHPRHARSLSVCMGKSAVRNILGLKKLGRIPEGTIFARHSMHDQSCSGLTNRIWAEPSSHSAHGFLQRAVVTLQGTRESARWDDYVRWKKRTKKDGQRLPIPSWDIGLALQEMPCFELEQCWSHNEELCEQPSWWSDTDKDLLGKLTEQILNLKRYGIDSQSEQLPLFAICNGTSKTAREVLTDA
ncbi:hypothetical protein PMIN01_11877 [Paraphaeosphaeria minitans]|uniref:Uncharacterized protein n=1 Tax=Paraphaeosphaeria minitans TaxID=565426 RepID=A0A9P6G6V0_9PLEO|nr:hypothetical protein PMIN01_11877 [Paraphaeosphaeria minitans]